MDREGVKEFLKELSGPNTKTVDRGAWVSTHCPLAKHRHGNGTDTNMSFGVKVNDGGISLYNCLACKSKGSLENLLSTLEGYTGDDFSNLKEQVGGSEFLSAALPPWDRRALLEDSLGEPVSEDYLDVYDDARGHPYLKERGISSSTSDDLMLQVDPDNKGVERLLFPVYAENGDFYGFSGRAITPADAEPRVRDYFGLKKRFLLLGTDILDFNNHDFVALTEGLFDFARMYQHGYPAVASLGSTLSKQQADILLRIGRPVYCFYDDDKAGRKGRDVVTELLAGHVPVLKVRYPRGIGDPGDIRLMKEDVEAMVDDARLM